MSLSYSQSFNTHAHDASALNHGHHQELDESNAHSHGAFIEGGAISQEKWRHVYYHEQKEENSDADDLHKLEALEHFAELSDMYQASKKLFQSYQQHSNWLNDLGGQLADEISRLKSSITRVDAEIVSTEQQITEQRAAIQQQEQTVIPKLEDEVEQLTEDHSVALAEAQVAADELETASRDLNEAELELQDAENNPATSLFTGETLAKDENGHYTINPDTGEKEYSGTVMEMTHSFLEWTGLQKEAKDVKKIQDRVQECESSCSVKRERFDTASAEEERLSEELTLKEQELKLAQDHLENQYETLNAQEARLAELQAEKGGYEAELAAVQEKKADLEGFKKEFESPEFQEKLASGEIQLDEHMAQNLPDSLRSDYAEFRRELEAENAPELSEQTPSLETSAPEIESPVNASPATPTAAAPQELAVTATENVVASATSAAAGYDGQAMLASVSPTSAFASAASPVQPAQDAPTVAPTQPDADYERVQPQNFALAV